MQVFACQHRNNLQSGQTLCFCADLIIQKRRTKMDINTALIILTAIILEFIFAITMGKFIKNGGSTND